MGRKPNSAQGVPLPVRSHQPACQVDGSCHRGSSSVAPCEIAPISLPNLPFRSEACAHIGGEHGFTIMEGATPTFMPDCDVVVIRGLAWEEA
jgi:hypothetical protein